MLVDVVNNSTTLLPRGEKLIIQADDQDYMRGLVIELLPEGGYNVNYWYNDPSEIYPIEVVVDGESVAEAGKDITLKFHPELKKDKPEMVETYNDYPKSATNNAKKAIEWREKYGRDEVKGGTRVGWQRANQLAKREKISRETIGRMAAFKRHEKNAKVDAKFKATPWKDKGYVAWLLWGGTSGVNWAIKKKESIDNSKK